MSHLGTSFSASSMPHKDESTKNLKAFQSARAETKAGTSSSSNKAQPKPWCRAHSGLKFVFKKKPIRPLLDFDTGPDHSAVNSSPLKVAAVSNEDQSEIVSSAPDGANINQTLNDTKLNVSSRDAKPNSVSVRVKLQEISKDVKSPLPKEIQTQLISRDTKIPSMSDKASKNVKADQQPSDAKPGLHSNQISKDVKLQEISKDVKSPLPQEIQTQLTSRDTKIPSMNDNSSKNVKAVLQPRGAKPGLHSNQISKDVKLKETPPSTAEVDSKTSTRKYGLHSGMRFLPKKQPTVAQPFHFQDGHPELKKKCSKD